MDYKDFSLELLQCAADKGCVCISEWAKSRGVDPKMLDIDASISEGSVFAMIQGEDVEIPSVFVISRNGDYLKFDEHQADLYYIESTMCKVFNLWVA